MKRLYKGSLAVALVVTMLFSYGCGGTTILSLLSTLTGACEIAVTELEAASLIPPTEGTLIQGYLQAAANATAQAEQLVLSGETGVKLASDIAGLFAGIVVPNVSPEAAAIVRGVAAAISNVLSFFSGAKTQKANLTVTPSQLVQVNNLSVRTAAVRGRLARRKK